MRFAPRGPLLVTRQFTLWRNLAFEYSMTKVGNQDENYVCGDAILLGR